MPKKLSDADRFRELLGRATLDELLAMRERLQDALAFRFPVAALSQTKKRTRKAKAAGEVQQA